jgi:TetR/AcrR family transcriptional repressor of nem operon
MLGGLDAPDAALPEIEAYFSGVIADLTGDGRRGCLIINSAAELGAEDPEVARVAWAHLRTLRDHFARALRNAAARGQTAAEAVDPAAGASLLMATASGLILAGKANPDRRMLRAIVRPALRAVGARA